MKIKGYGAWPPKNVLSGGQKAPLDPYNKALKGGERGPRADEYALSGMDEYHHYPAQKDFSAEQSDKKNDAQSKNKERQAKQARAQRQRLLQQVVGVVVGSVVVVSSYTAMAERRQAAAESPPAVVQSEDSGTDQQGGPGQTDTEQNSLSPNWKWSEDNETVILELSDGDGNVVKEIDAIISISEDEPTCNKEGVRTFTATADDDGNTYSDSRTEPIEPLGHSFDDGKEVVLEDGQRAMTFKCTRCYEEFTIRTSMTENDR